MLNWNDLENKKLEKEIRMFLESREEPVIEEERKRQSLEFLRLQRKSIHITLRKPYGQRVLEQAAYISPAAWVFQGLLVLVLGTILNTPFDMKEIVLANLSICAPIIGVIGFTEVMRSYQKNMWELEQACRYNLRQLAGMRLLLFAAADILVVAGVMVGGLSLGFGAEELLLFFLVPQLLSDSVYLYLMARFRRKFQGTVLIGAAVLMTLFWIQISMIIMEAPWLIYELSRPWALTFFIVVSATLLTALSIRFLHGIEKEEEGRWNFGWTD
ncbi:MAG: hypothetical protein HFJ10_01410 [Lachnospiraceae bacterium]|nr:hypothetical protein [Lachnospiraceae bacterium]